MRLLNKLFRWGKNGESNTLAPLPVLDDPDSHLLVPLVRSYKRETDEGVDPGSRQADPRTERIFEPLCGNLAVYYAFDRGNTFDYLTRDRFAAYGVGLASLRRLALENLSRTLPEIKRLRKSESFMLVADGNIESSLLLLDHLWDTEAANVQGRIIAAVPARDVLVFTSSESMVGLWTVRDAINRVNLLGANLVSDSLLVRMGNRWLEYDPNTRSSRPYEPM